MALSASLQEYKIAPPSRTTEFGITRKRQRKPIPAEVPPQISQFDEMSTIRGVLSKKIYTQRFILLVSTPFEYAIQANCLYLKSDSTSLRCLLSKAGDHKGLIISSPGNA